MVLILFTYDYNTGITSWKWEHMFTELEPKDVRQKTVWENNRKRIYRVSVTNFIKTLYNNTLTSLLDEGYLLTYPRKEDIPVFLPKEPYQKPETFLSPALDRSKRLYIPPALDGLMLVCFGTPISHIMLNEVRLTQDKTVNWPRIGLFRILLETPNPVLIYSDGTYKGTLGLNTGYFSNSLLGFHLTLPVEYTP